MRRAAGGGFDLLGGDGIFTNYSKRSAVVIKLRINSILMPIGGHSVGVGKKCLLARGPVGWQSSLVLSEGPADAETKFAQRLDARPVEKLEEKAGPPGFCPSARRPGRPFPPTPAAPVTH